MQEAAFFYRGTLIPGMEALRAMADAVERYLPEICSRTPAMRNCSSASSCVSETWPSGPCAQKGKPDPPGILLRIPGGSGLPVNG